MVVITSNNNNSSSSNLNPLLVVTTNNIILDILARVSRKCPVTTTTISDPEVRDQVQVPGRAILLDMEVPGVLLATLLGEAGRRATV